MKFVVIFFYWIRFIFTDLFDWKCCYLILVEKYRFYSLNWLELVETEWNSNVNWIRILELDCWLQDVMECVYNLFQQVGSFDCNDTTEFDSFQRRNIANERFDSFMGLLQSPRRGGTSHLQSTLIHFIHKFQIWWITLLY